MTDSFTKIMLLTTIALAVMLIGIMMLAAYQLTPYYTDTEPEYYSGILSDVDVTSGGFMNPSRTILYFEDGQVISVVGVIDDLRIGNNYDLKHLHGRWGLD